MQGAFGPDGILLLFACQWHLITFASSLARDQAHHNMRPDLDPIFCLTWWQYSIQIKLILTKRSVEDKKFMKLKRLDIRCLEGLPSPDDDYSNHQQQQLNALASKGLIWLVFIVWEQRRLHCSGDCSFFGWWGEEGSRYHYKRAIICPPGKRHLNGVSMACRCWPTLNTGLVHCL